MSGLAAVRVDAKPDVRDQVDVWQQIQPALRDGFGDGAAGKLVPQISPAVLGRPGARLPLPSYFLAIGFRCQANKVPGVTMVATSARNFRPNPLSLAAHRRCWFIHPPSATSTNRNGSRTLGISLAHYREPRAAVTNWNEFRQIQFPDHTRKAHSYRAGTHSWLNGAPVVLGPVVGTLSRHSGFGIQKQQVESAPSV
jgi:hypothetical protein